MANLTTLMISVGVFVQISVGETDAQSVQITPSQQTQALELSKEVTANNPSLVIPAYRNIIVSIQNFQIQERIGAELEKGDNVRDNTLIEKLGSSLQIYNGVPTLVDTDRRTIDHFIESARSDNRILLGVSPVENGRDLFPDAAAIFSTSGSLCSGTLISKDTVLTAAHCFCNGDNLDMPKAVIFGLSTSDLSREVIEADAANSIPKVKCGGELKDGDVGIVRLKTASSKPPRHLAHTNAINKSNVGRVVGFGLSENHNAGTKTMASIPIMYAGTKLMASTPITSHACNGKTDKGIDDSIAFGCKESLELVAASSSKEDSCLGDSGGGLFIQMSNGEFAVGAVVARGVIGQSSKCGGGGIYVRVDGPVLDWLREKSVAVVVDE